MEKKLGKALTESSFSFIKFLRNNPIKNLRYNSRRKSVTKHKQYHKNQNKRSAYKTQQTMHSNRANCRGQ
jgi:hypothetical protein